MRLFSEIEEIQAGTAGSPWPCGQWPQPDEAKPQGFGSQLWGEDGGGAGAPVCSPALHVLKPQALASQAGGRREPTVATDRGDCSSPGK